MPPELVGYLDGAPAPACLSIGLAISDEWAAVSKFMTGAGEPLKGPLIVDPIRGRRDPVKGELATAYSFYQYRWLRMHWLCAEDAHSDYGDAFEDGPFVRLRWQNRNPLKRIQMGLRLRYTKSRARLDPSSWSEQLEKRRAT